MRPNFPAPTEINASAHLVHSPSAISPDVLRPLGGMERLLLLLDQTNPIHFSTAAEIEGPTTVRSWRLALDAVQRRHPFFSVCVDEDENGNPCFRRVDGPEIPLRVVDAKHAESQWEQELERELSTRFDPKQTPLIRAVLLYRPDKSTLILTAHHSIGDGISMAYAIRDTLRALAGERLESLAPLPCLEELLGMPRPSLVKPASSTSSGIRPGSVGALSNNNADTRAHVKALRLSPELTSKLLIRARQEETTVHGALCAALVLAGKQVFSGWKNPVRIHSSVDARRLLRVGENYMQLAFGGIVPVDPQAVPDFWDMARLMKRGLAPVQSLEGIAAGLAPINELLLQGLDSQSLSQVAKQSHAHDATLTNLGRLPFDTRIGGLTLTSIWGPAINLDSENGQTVGAATANGSLCLLYTSAHPASSLLEVMEQMIDDEVG